MLKSLSYLTLLASLAGLTPAQSLCIPNTHVSNSSKTWGVNLTVTNAEGISLRSLTLHQTLSANTTISVYLRNGSITTAHLSSASGWNLHDTNVDGDGADYDIADLYLAPGAYALAIVRSGGAQGRTASPTSVQNTDLLIASVGNTSGNLGGLVFTEGLTGCFHYTVGRWDSTIVASVVDDGGQPVLTSISSSPDDVDGNSSGIAGFSHTYDIGTIVELSAADQVGAMRFKRWKIDGVFQPWHDTTVDFVTSQVTHTVVAEYGLPQTLSLTSTLDGSATNATVTTAPDDLDDVDVTATPSTRSFLQDRTITVTAEPVLGEHDVFRHWVVDGTTQPSVRGRLEHVVDGSVSMTAVYHTVPCFESDLGTALGMGDETIAVDLALGFDFAVPGGGTTNTINVCSNGYFWLGDDTGIDATPTGQEFEDQGARIAPFWADLTFDGTVGDVYFNTFDDRAVVTWHLAQLAGDETPFTVQCQLFSSGGMFVSFSQSVPSEVGAVLVGFSEGGGVDHYTDLDLFNPLAWATLEATKYQERSTFRLQGRLWSFAPFHDRGYQGLSIDCTPARSRTYGSGCGEPSVTTFYQFGDGSSFGPESYSVAMTLNEDDGYDVAACSSDCYESTRGAFVAMADDALHTVALPFSLPYPGNPLGSTSITVSSNGFVWLDSNSTAASDWQADPDALRREPARLAPMWVDLDPTAAIADGVYVRSQPDRVVITWHQIPEFGGSVLLTAQCQLFHDGRIVMHRIGTPSRNPMLLGFSPGGLQTGTEVDFAADMPFSTRAEADALVLEISSGAAPRVDATLELHIRNPWPTTLNGALFVGTTQTAVDLSFVGAPGCSLLNNVNATFPVSISTTDVSVPFPMPEGPSGVGLVWHFQAATLSPGVNALGVATSNGLELTMGEL